MSRPCICGGLSDPPADKFEDMAVRVFEMKTPTPTCQPAGHLLLSEHFEHQWVEALVPNLDRVVGAKWKGNLPLQHFLPSALPDRESL